MYEGLWKLTFIFIFLVRSERGEWRPTYRRGGALQHSLVPAGDTEIKSKWWMVIMGLQGAWRPPTVFLLHKLLILSLNRPGFEFFSFSEMKIKTRCWASLLSIWHWYWFHSSLLCSMQKLYKQEENECEKHKNVARLYTCLRSSLTRFLVNANTIPVLLKGYCPIKSQPILLKSSLRFQDRPATWLFSSYLILWRVADPTPVLSHNIAKIWVRLFKNLFLLMPEEEKPGHSRQSL